MKGAPLMDVAPRLVRQPAYWLFVMLLLSSFTLVGMEQTSYLASYPGAWFLSILNP